MTISDKTVRGHLELATRQGFVALMEQANLMAEAGFTMIGIVNVGAKSLGGVFVRLPKPSAPPSSSLV